MKKALLVIPLLGLLIWFLSYPALQTEKESAPLQTKLAHPSEIEPQSVDQPTPPVQEAMREHAATADLKLPKLDHSKLLEKARKYEAEGRHLFAVSREVRVAPHLAGKWDIADDRARWSFQLESEGATSLNLAFSQFALPDGGELIISDPKGIAGEVRFTSADQDAHGELWTPILETDQLLVQLDLPRATAQQVRLNLAQVNHGFRNNKRGKAIGDGTSGSCNIDVVCSAADDPNFGPLIDMYRDQIRSVAAYTVGGVETCSGALINNARNDQRPFFLTANHCEITSANAPSIVVYWNFENTTCRQPNTSASGSNGDGRIDQFNSGSIFRATRAESDFCLIELDDPVDSAYNPFYAGWDRTGANPNMVVGIHHPAVSEKRISFELNPTTTTFYYSNSSNASATHVRVGDWDYGTTEGGSSGSPLFDDFGRIIGQLHGGDAACGNNDPDWYGRVSRSWADGGTAATQLSSWLDPDSSGITTIDGINADELITIGNLSITEGDSGTSSGQVTLTLSETTTDTVTVRIISSPDTASQSDFVAIDQIVTFPPNTLTRTVTVTVNGDVTPEEHEQFLLTLSQPTNAQASSQAGRVTILNDDIIAPSINSSLTAVAFVNELFEYQITAANTPDTFAIANQPTGMTIDPITGMISWIPTTAGPATVTITASNSGGSDSETLSITVNDNPLSEAIDISTPVSVTSSSPSWFRQTTTSFDGEDAAQSASITDSESSTLSMTLTGPMHMSFQWKVSSEEGYDWLFFTVDGQIVSEVPPITGEIDWVEIAYEVPAGSHTLSWSYLKDESVSEGQDAGWVDDVRLETDTRPIAWTQGSVLGVMGVAVQIPIEFINTTSYSFNNLPAWLSYDSETNLISGTPPSTGTYAFQAVASNALESHSRTITLTVITSTPGLPTTLGQTDLIVATSGNQDWFTDSSLNPVAASSGNITDDQFSTMSIWVQGPGTLNFEWSVSSEQGFDYLIYSLNEVFQDEISGSFGWETVSVPLAPGINVVSWTYEKDGSVSENGDRGLVRNITLDGFADFLYQNNINHYASSPADDDDSNGRSLLYEYAFQVTPGDESSLNPLAYNQHPTEANTVNLQFIGLNTDDDVEYYIEATDDLLDPDWQILPGTFQTAPSGPNATSYTFETQVPATDLPDRYYRIGVRFKD